MEHYDAIINFIRAYNITHEEELFKHEIEKNVFIALADSVCEIIDSENSNNTKIDYNSVVENTYNKIFVPIIRNLIDMNEKMQSQLEDVLKHGQKVTLVVKDVDKTVELVKDAKKLQTMTESDMNNKVWPSELYKFRGSGGMATYKHIDSDIYEDMTCQDHVHCRIRVKPVDEHYEFVEAVNESAKRFVDFHTPYDIEPVPHIYEDKDMVMKSVLEWQIDNSRHKIEKYTKELAEAEEKLKKMRRKKLRPQTLDNLNFDDEIIILSSLLRLKDYQKRRITHKVSNKNGVDYLLAGNEFEVRNKDNKEFLDVRCSYYDDDYERNVDKSYLGFCSIKDFENYRNNRDIDEIEEDIRILKAGIEQCETYITRNQEKLKEYNL